MKIESKNLKKLMSKPIYQLSEQELNALAFLLDIKISKYSKNRWVVKFKMKHQRTAVFVECRKGTNISMGKSDKVVRGLSGLTSFGGTFSFASTVGVFRAFFTNGYELTLQSAKVHKLYGKDVWENLVLSADRIVEAA